MLEAAIAAMLDATEFVPVEDDVGVLALIDVPALPLETDPNEPPPVLLELTSCPADVGNAADAPPDPEPIADVAEAPDVAIEAAVAAGAIDPRRGTDAAAPPVPALM